MIWRFGDLLILIFILSACGSEKTETGQDKRLAKVGEVKLNQSDLIGLFPIGTSKADSAEITNRYVNNWIRKQLLITKARQAVKIDEAEIERKLLDYRYDLIAYEFEKDYIRKNLDTTVSEDEIKAYYEKNPANFELKQNIVKALLVKIAQDTTKRKETLKALLLTNDKKEALKLKEYCVKYAPRYSLNDSTWVDFEDLVRESPFQQIVNKTDFIRQNTFAESVEKDAVYYLRIKEYKLSNQASPMPFVRDRIVNMIVNQRKVQLAKKLEQAVFEEAKKNKGFEVFR